jgi:hypothetical protein
MRRHPDKAALSKSFYKRVRKQLLGPGVLRQELQAWSGQECGYWRPFIEEMAAASGHSASRHRDAANQTLTRFIIKEGDGWSNVAGYR